jgi:TolA-binding protein
MIVVELHPEQLIDKEIQGRLSEDERVRLNAHVAACSVCHLERLSRGDFRNDFVVEANRAKLSRIVSLALEEAGLAGGTPDVSGERSTVRAPAGRAPRVSLRTRLAVSLAAALLMASVVAAAWPEMRHVFAAWKSADRVETTAKWTSPPEPPASRSGPPAVTPRDPDPEASREVLSVVPSTVVRTAKRARARPEGLAPDRSAAAIFAEANDALRRKAYARARALYEDLESRYSGSPEAQTALAILGRLALDAGQAAAALRYFDAYAAGSGGALVEEAAVGRALALERLRRTSEEAAAWTSFLAGYPASAHAAHARARLAVLGEH